MKKDDECKIIEDLLPNYIENLTSDITNKFIEEHIKKCEKCKEVLKAMNGELKLEKLNKEQEIDYLKKINNRNRKVKNIAIISSIIAIILFIIVSVYIVPKYIWQVKQEGKVDIMQTLFGTKEVMSKWTYYVAEKTIEDSENSLNGKNYKEIRIVQVEENSDECTNYKYIAIGLNEKYIKKQVEVLHIVDEDDESGLDNLKYDNNSYSFNNKLYIKDRSKEQIIKALIENDDDSILKEY